MYVTHCIGARLHAHAIDSHSRYLAVKREGCMVVEGVAWAYCEGPRLDHPHTWADAIFLPGATNFLIRNTMLYAVAPPKKIW